MQRLLSLGVLGALVTGGWSILTGAITPQSVARVAQTVQGVVASGNWQPVGPASPFGTSPYAGAGYSYNAPPPVVVQPNLAVGTTIPPGAEGLIIRIASFNVEALGDAKGRKPQVMAALGQIVKQFDVVAIQEIRTQDDYFIPNFLRTYVNNDGQTFYDARVSKRLGNTTVTEQYAYLFNTAKINVHPQVDFVVPDPSNALHREPHVAMFQTRVQPVDRAFTFLLVNTHVDPDEVPKELDALGNVYREVQRLQISGLTEDDVILLGDLNTAVPAAGPYTPNPAARPLAPRDLFGLGQVSGIFPAIRSEATNTAGTKLHDNILVSRFATTEFTGRSGVLNVPGVFQLSRDQAEMVSDHLPVWAEFTAYESQVVGRVALAP
ncbi:MAG: endonuclease/exonuclease/phosphatase family protein [Lacipirellulaceae bacterium]